MVLVSKNSMRVIALRVCFPTEFENQVFITTLTVTDMPVTKVKEHRELACFSMPQGKNMLEIY